MFEWLLRIYIFTFYVVTEMETGPLQTLETFTTMFTSFLLSAAV